jgi:hypothetical protein
MQWRRLIRYVHITLLWCVFHASTYVCIYSNDLFWKKTRQLLTMIRFSLTHNFLSERVEGFDFIANGFLLVHLYSYFCPINCIQFWLRILIISPFRSYSAWVTLLNPAVKNCEDIYHQTNFCSLIFKVNFLTRTSTGRTGLIRIWIHLVLDLNVTVQGWRTLCTSY